MRHFKRLRLAPMIPLQQQQHPDQQLNLHTVQLSRVSQTCKADPAQARGIQHELVDRPSWDLFDSTTCYGKYHTHARHAAATFKLCLLIQVRFQVADSIFFNSFFANGTDLWSN